MFSFVYFQKSNNREVRVVMSEVQRFEGSVTQLIAIVMRQKPVSGRQGYEHGRTQEHVTTASWRGGIH